MANKSTKYTIYLCRNKDVDDDILIKEVATLTTLRLELPETVKAILFVQKVYPQVPSWSSLFKPYGVKEKDIGKGCSPRAVLVVRLKVATFLITFGHGRHLIYESQIERDFGLRVALNSIHEDKLRSIDKASHEKTPLNSRTQASKSVDILELAVNTELDLLTSITGSSKVEVFGAQVTGRDALAVNVKSGLDGLGKLLKNSHLYFSKKDYEKEFGWVDNFRRIRDEIQVANLDAKLLELIKMKTVPENCWLAEPEIIDWESTAFYVLEKKGASTQSFPELRIDKLLTILKERHDNKLSIDIIRNHSIYLVDDNLSPLKTWSAYNCIYAEIKEQSSIYILQNGNWYKVDDDFVQKVDRIVGKIKKYIHKLPLYDHENEGAYNEHVEGQTSYFKMDKKNIGHGGGHSKIEYCDLIKDGTDLIHVKRGTGSSNLSHLFAQGEVSAELFCDDESFREKVNKILSDDLKMIDITKRPDVRNYTIVYAIVSERKGELNLPFFSKVTLKNAAKHLGLIGYNVALAKIDVTDEYRIKSKIKADAKLKKKA